jgi:hypothetical protein
MNLEKTSNQTYENEIKKKDVKYFELPINFDYENTLQNIGSIILICGIVTTLICFFTITWDDGDFVPIGFSITVGVFFTSLITWAFLRVICKISRNLHEINDKIKMK